MTATKDLSEQTRLELIAEAVRYCQRVRSMGMPASAYTKALREPIHFLWERRHGSKDSVATFRSIASEGYTLNSGQITYDHAVPFIYLQDELLALEDVHESAVRTLLERFNQIVLITKEENRILDALGLRHRMPASWDRVDSFARYSEAGIELMANTFRRT